MDLNYRPQSSNTSAQKKDKYFFHPSIIWQLISWIIRFIWLLIIATWVVNYMMEPTDVLPKMDIITASVLITFFWILFFLLWNILYAKKYWRHFWGTLVYAIIVLFIWLKIVNIYWGHWYHWLSFFDEDNYLQYIAFPVVAYFALYTVLRSLRFFIFKLTWKLRGKILDSEKETNSVWSFITILLLFLLITVISLWKIKFTSLPTLSASIFERKDYVEQLPEDKDWFKQLKKIDEEWINWHKEFWETLDAIYLWEMGWEDYKNEKLWWQWHQDECDPVWTWETQYCWTWLWSRSTIRRMLNRKFNYISHNENKKLEYDWKEITIYAYLKRHEAQMTDDIKELNRILSLNYYINTWDILNTYPQFFQSHTRWSIVALQYYVWEKNDEMVKLIIKNNKEMVKHMFNVWTNVWVLIWTVIENTMNSMINSLNPLFSNELRYEIIKIYDNYIEYKEEIMRKSAKWEYNLWTQTKNEVKDRNPSLYEAFYNYPFYSEKETNKLMVYYYTAIYNNNYSIDLSYIDWSYLWPFNAIWINQAITLLPKMLPNNTLWLMIKARESLVKNLKAWNNSEWFDRENRWNNIEQYEQHILKDY